MDPTLVSPELNLSWSFRRFVALASMLVFVVYLFLGNLPRFGSVAETGNTFPVTEIVLYLVVLGGGAVCRRLVKDSLCFVLPVLGLVSLSFLYGIIVNGFVLKAFVFSVRLQLQFLVGVFIGSFAFWLYGFDYIGLMKSFLRVYLGVLAFSFCIFFVFNDSMDLYGALASLGIHYVGDPHVGRLISSYLDPNLFSCILLLPFVVSVWLFMSQPRLLNFCYIIFFLGGVFYTVSRSGLGSLAILLMFFFFRGLIYLYSRRVIPRRLLWYLLPSIILVSFVALGRGSDLIARIAERFAEPVTQEESALLRLESFLIGFDVLQNHPLFGVGYNFGVIFAESRTLVSEHEGVQVGFDSSLLTMAVNFGLVATIGFFILLFRWFRRLWLALAQFSGAQSLFVFFVSYLVVTIFFSSSFNNILFYQFWLVPVVALCRYFALLASGGVGGDRLAETS